MSSILRCVSACAALCLLTRFVVACGDDEGGGGGTTPDGGGLDSSTTDSGGTSDGGGGDSGPVSPNANLDPTFGKNGIVAIEGTEPSSDAVVAVLRQPDGKLVAVIRNVDVFGTFLVRFDAAGALDDTFGIGGKVFVSSVYGWSGAVQSDGKFLIGGQGIRRVNTDGTLDTSWGSNGFTTSEGTVNAVVQLADGKVIAAGVRPNGGGWTVWRYTSGGQLDTTFDGDGRAEDTTSIPDGRAQSIVVDSSNRILVAGEAFGNKMLPVVRYLPDGTLDDSFGTNGQKIIDVPGTGLARGIALQGDGKIVVAGVSGSNFVVARLSSTDGSLDPTFGTPDGGVDGGGAGITFGPTGASYNGSTGVAILAGGQIVAGTSTGFFRVTTDGTVDATINVNTSNPKIPTQGFQEAMTVLPDGSMIGGGTFNGKNGYSPALWKVTSSFAIDTAFATAGELLLPMHARDDQLGQVDVLPSGKILAAGVHGPGIVARFEANGAVDKTFGTDGFADVYGEPSGMARDGSGRIFVIEGFSVRALTPEGKRDTTWAGDAAFAEVRSTATSEWLIGEALTVDPSGRPLVVGRAGGTQAGEFLTVVRLTAAGMQDATFGTTHTNGAYTGYRRMTADAQARAIVALPDGKVIVTGSTTGGAFAMRLTSAGVLDATFAGGGFATIAGLPDARSISIQSDAKILLCGGGKVARLDANGALDPSFGTGGITEDLPNAGVDAEVVRVRSDGKIMVMGNRTVNGTGGGIDAVATARLSATGAVESTGLPTFTVPVGGLDMAILPNGAAIVAGYTVGPLTQRDMMLAKVLP